MNRATGACVRRRLPLARLLEGSSTPLLEMREDRFHLLAVQTQVGHADALVLGEEREGERVALREHLVRLRDIAREPGALAHPSRVRQGRTEPIALADGMAATNVGA